MISLKLSLYSCEISLRRNVYGGAWAAVTLQIGLQPRVKHDLDVSKLAAHEHCPDGLQVHVNGFTFVSLYVVMRKRFPDKKGSVALPVCRGRATPCR